MGKLVKYCSSCEEGFAERFGFCPNCGGGLEAFEMNPVVKNPEILPDANANNLAQTQVSVSAAAEVPLIVPETQNFSSDDVLELDSVDTRETVVEKETETITADASAFNSGADDYEVETIVKGANFSKNDDDGGYHVTVVSEKASSWFQPFLLSLFGLAFLAVLASYAIAIMIHGLDIPEIDIVESGYFLTEEEPVQTEEVVKKKDEEGGGGGGGGKNNPDPASKGRLPDQTDKPLNAPMPLPVMRNPSLAVVNQTQGTNKREQTDEQVGIPNSLSDKVSSGGGSGGGIGNGNGTGVGNGRGTGEGNGNGSGSGNGIGNGNGDGLGDGDGDRTPQVAKKVTPVGETKSITITAKPSPRYTDAARQNNIQGTVRLRVTFNANGTVGGVSPVNSLPNGLTEQAIAAAKQIRFQPAMRNGQAISVTKQIEYNFTIY